MERPSISFPWSLYPMTKVAKVPKHRILTAAQLEQVKGNGIGTSPSVVEPPKPVP